MNANLNPLMIETVRKGNEGNSVSVSGMPLPTVYSYSERKQRRITLTSEQIEGLKEIEHSPVAPTEKLIELLSRPSKL